MNKISIQFFKTPFGELILDSFKHRLCLCDWRYRKMRPAIDKRIQNGLDTYYEEKETTTIQVAKHQLNEYFSGDRNVFDIPLQMIGTSFQQSVWNELLKIPYGKTESYLRISQKLNNEKAIRAVAAANGANAIAIFVPCHRVIASDGKLIGYAGGLSVKKKLLQLETNREIPEQLQLFNNF